MFSVLKIKQTSLYTKSSIFKIFTGLNTIQPS